jgi:ATP-dependent DNA ligase
MPTLKHFPDKPWERHPKDLLGWDQSGDYICQQKTDGWRMEVCKGLGDIHYISRHNKPMDDRIEDHIQQQMQILLAEVPDRSQFDGEWLSLREATNKKTKPRLVLFDVIRFNKRWLLRTTYQERWVLLQEVFSKVDPKLIPDISLAETAPDGEFLAFYEAQKKLPHSEGVVVKHKESVLLGDRKESKKNPRWYKCKYRGMSDGQGLLDHLR